MEEHLFLPKEMYKEINDIRKENDGNITEEEFINLLKKYNKK